MLRRRDRAGTSWHTLRRPGGRRLGYTLSLPDRIEDDISRPLVLSLHHGWDRQRPVPLAFGAALLTDVVEPALRDLGAIFVAPDCPAREWTEPASEGAVLALVERLQKRYAVDPARIVVTGFSLGAWGSWFFASRHPALFSAALPISGWPDIAAVDSLEPSAVYAIHSRADEVVPLGPTSLAITNLQARGRAAHLVVLDDVTHLETGRFTDALRDAVPWVREQWKRQGAVRH